MLRDYRAKRAIKRQPSPDRRHRRRSDGLRDLSPTDHIPEIFTPDPLTFIGRPMQQRLRRYRAAAIRARVLEPPDERERTVEIVFVAARSPTSSTQSVGMAWG